jgi:hypothetical protein
MAVDSRTETPVTAPSGTPTGRRVPPWAVVAALVAGAWVLPLLAHLVGLDALVLLVLLVGTASLLRAGRTLLDRLVLAAGTLAGLLIAAGLLFSVWPWGLAPVPVGGSTLTVLVLVGVVLRRRPSLPLRVSLSDTVLLGGGLLAGLVAAAPTLRGGSTQDLAYSAINGDRMRHVNLFDTIGQVGGYTFLNFDKARPMVEEAMAKSYPSGMHYLYALIESFVTGGHAARGLTVLVHYYWYVLVGYGFFVLAVGWAARWAAGPRLAGWRAVLVTATVTLWLATGIMTTLVWEAFDPEVLALGFLAIALAVLARPPASVGEQLLITTALIVAVCFTYSLFLPLIGVAALVGLVVYRRRLWRHRWLALPMIVVAAIVAATPLVLPQLLFHFNAGKQLAMFGFIVPVPKKTLFFLAALALGGLAVPALRRLPRLKALAGMVGGTTALVGLFWLYQNATLGATQYYVYKLMQALVVFYLVAAGTLVLRIRDTVRRPAVQLAASAAAVIVAVAFSGAATFKPIQFRYQDMRPGPDTNWGAVWANGRLIYGPYAPTIAALDRAGYLSDGKPTLVVFDNNGLLNVHVTLVAATANRQLGLLNSQVYGMAKVTDLVAVKAQIGGVLPPKSAAGLSALEDVVRSSPVPVRVIVSDPLVADRLRTFADSSPNLGLQVVLMSDLPAQGAVWDRKK